MRPDFAVQNVPHVITALSSTLVESSVVDRRPINEYDALMRTAPGDNPQEHQGEVQPLREAIAAAIEQLTDEHRFIIEAIHAERLSYAELGERLGVSKTQAFRLTRQAEAALKQHLTHGSALIRERIHMNSTWQEAAATALETLVPVGTSPSDELCLATIERKMDRLRALVHTTSPADLLIGPICTIGTMAACMLDNAGAWSQDELLDLLIRKQHDYGHGNINAFGLIGIVVRMSDKVARWKNLADREGMAEPKIDALVDLVGYAVIARMIDDNTFNLMMGEAHAH